MFRWNKKAPLSPPFDSYEELLDLKISCFIIQIKNAQKRFMQKNRYM